MSGRRAISRRSALLGALAIIGAAGAMGIFARGEPGTRVGPGATDGVAYAAASEAADLQSQRPTTHVVERMGPFEYTVNSVLGRYLNVPGTD